MRVAFVLGRFSTGCEAARADACCGAHAAVRTTYRIPGCESGHDGKAPPTAQRTGALTLSERLPDASIEELAIIERVQPYTMTSPERILALVRAIDYLEANDVPGDLVECGVWRGGSMMAALLRLRAIGSTHRRAWLYDTFEGMSPPTERDEDFCGRSAQRLLAEQARDDPSSIWCRATLAETRRNLDSVGYPAEHLRFVVGPVEETLAREVPSHIALLRLDTDWYESTRAELEVLFPRLVSGGVLLIDDYGHWKGCRRAVDEYVSGHRLRLHLQRIDYTGRLAIVQAETTSRRESPWRLAARPGEIASTSPAAL